MNAFVEKTLPVQFSIGASLLPDRQVGFEFNLLNPGDEAYIAVYVYNSDPRIPQLDGRVVDIPQLSMLEVSPRTNPMPWVTKGSVRATIFWSLSLVNAAVALGALSWWAFGIGSFLRGRVWAYRWRSEFFAAAKEANIVIDEFYRRHLDMAMVRYPGLKPALTEKSVPEPTAHMFDTWNDMLTAALILGGITLLCGLSFLYVYTGPR